MIKKLLAPLALAASTALLLSGCVTNTEGPTGGETFDPSTVTVDDAAAALLPDAIRDRGVLRVGVDASYAPNEFEGPDGAPIGWEVELTTAVAAKLGLEVEWQKLLFDQIIPQVSGGTLDLGSSSFTDTTERQKQVDFVDFYEAGLQYAKAPDAEPIGEDLCGLTIAVQATTTSDDFLTAASEECTKKGKPAIEVLRSDNQDEATNNAVIGRAPYMLADSPITQYGVQQSAGKLELDGDYFDAAPYGLACGKDTGLAEAVKAAMESLLADGTYDRILSSWGVEAGRMDTIEINSVK